MNIPKKTLVILMADDDADDRADSRHRHNRQHPREARRGCGQEMLDRQPSEQRSNHHREDRLHHRPGIDRDIRASEQLHRQRRQQR